MSTNGPSQPHLEGAFSQFPSPEAAPLLRHFGSLLQPKDNGDFRWGQQTAEGKLEGIAIKEHEFIRGAALYTPVSERERSFLVRWSQITEWKAGYSPTGVQVLQPNQGPLSWSQKELLLEENGEQALPLLQAERAVIGARLLGGITAATEIEIPRLRFDRRQMKRMKQMEIAYNDNERRPVAAQNPALQEIVVTSDGRAKTIRHMIEMDDQNGKRFGMDEINVSRKGVVTSAVHKPRNEQRGLSGEVFPMDEAAVRGLFQYMSVL